MVTKQVLLYHTDGCHLCEKAMQIAHPIATVYRYVIQQVDIIDQPDLFEAYAISIPVIYDADTQQILYWPFNENDVLIFFQALKQ